ESGSGHFDASGGHEHRTRRVERPVAHVDRVPGIGRGPGPGCSGGHDVVAGLDAEGRVESGPHDLDAITGADVDIAGIGRYAPAGHERVGEDTDSVAAHLGQAAVVVVVVHEPFGSGRG